MTRHIIVLISLVLLNGALTTRADPPSAGGCLRPHAGDIAAMQDHDEAYARLQADIESAGTWEAKKELVDAFLDAHYGHRKTFVLVSYIARRYFSEQKSDPAGALDYLRSRWPLQASGDQYAETVRLLARLCGEAHRGSDLRALYDDYRSRADDLETIYDFSRYALMAEDWSLTRDASTALLDLNSTDRIRAQAGAGGITDEWSGVLSRKYSSSALINRGFALVMLGDAERGLAGFAQAESFTVINVAGCPGWPNADYYILWARALLHLGRHAEAMDRVALDATIRNTPEAIDTFTQAFVSDGGKPAYLPAALAAASDTRARTMPDFTAYNYQGSPRTFKSLAGKVTIIEFWHPT